MAPKTARMRIFRKGTFIDLWFNVFEFVIVFLAAGILYEIINNEAENGVFVKNYLARDSALLINTIYSSPGNVEYDYTEKTGAFVFDIRQNSVEVYLPSETTEGGKISYPFAEDKTLILSYSTIQPTSADSKLKYKKDSSGISIAR